VGLPLWAQVGVGVGLAAAVAYTTTPVAILTARRLAFYDHPIGYKGHSTPTPYLGGAAVMMAFALALLIGTRDPGRTLPLLGGVAVLFVTGTIDDRRPVSPQLRVAIELVLGGALGAGGFGWHLGAGPAVDALAMAIWVVAVVNAFNLFDNMDGAASTMAMVVAAGASVLALVSGNHWAAAGSAALCGACLGFLPHNLTSPAKIFLGDGGSMPLGFAVAALVANAARGAEPSSLALLVGFLLVGIPAIDTLLVIVSRRRRRVSILTGGQDHLTHRTRRRMRTARNVALVLGSTQALVSALVIVATRASSTTLVYILLAFVVCATAAIVGLDDIALPGATYGAEDVTVSAPIGHVQRFRRNWSGHAATLAVAALGLGAGLSPFFSGYYSTGVWVPLGLMITLAAAIATIGRAPRVTAPVVLTLAGLTGLGLWSALSTSWAGAVEQATVAANRWLSYAALLLLLIVLLQSGRRAKVLFGAIGIGIAAVALSILIRMLGTETSTLFFDGRLNTPLGYINGEGCVFAMASWGGLALAERREPWLAGMGAAAAVAMACMTLLSQSRGAAIAVFAALIVTVLVVPGRRRRVLALAVIAAGLAAAAGPILHIYSATGTKTLADADVHEAAIATLLSSGLTGFVWAIVVAATNFTGRREARRVLVARIATGVTVIVLAIPLVALAVGHSAVERTVRTQWHEFVHRSNEGPASSTQSRLLSGTGNRYDYWRVAWDAFLAHPVGGVGAGNFPAAYFKGRHTQESVQNPHSLVFQTLSEVGAVGLALLVLLVGGVVLGARRLREAARHSSAARTTLVAAGGAAIVWFVDSNGDWMQLLPGVTAIALAAVAVLCTQGDVYDSTDRRLSGKSIGRVPALAGIAALAFVLAVAGAGLARAGLTRIYLNTARGELAARPAAAIRDAGRVLRLDRANLDAYYVKAAGQASFNDSAAARATLLAAAREDPSDFVTWALLGDLEIRLRNFVEAKSFYQRAHALDPRDPGLAKLAADPASALGSSSAG
jgi:UDP-GlcNAc:undecaprenyl-phosphate GlcNAc-1-phosphate transferase